MSDHFIRKTDPMRSIFHGTSIGLLSVTAAFATASVAGIVMDGLRFDPQTCEAMTKILGTGMSVVLADSALDFFRQPIEESFGYRAPSVPALYSSAYGMSVPAMLIF